MEQEEDDFGDEHDGEEEEEEPENEEEEGQGENGDGKTDNKDAEMEELEKEYMNLRHQEQLYLRRTRPSFKQQVVNLDNLRSYSHLRTLTVMVMVMVMVMRIGHGFLSCCREMAFYSLNKLHAKKMKIVDRRASKSRKKRYQ
ncbi:unnamed protein product [Malus baccata var. baccata]